MATPPRQSQDPARVLSSPSAFGLVALPGTFGACYLARIVHCADGLQPQAVEADRDLDPIARGLEAIAVGYSQHFPDDVENLAHHFEVYDALYAWCRLQAAKEG